MSTSSTATPPFIPIKYESFIETPGENSVAFQKCILDGIEKKIFQDPAKQDAIRLRLDMDRKLTVYPLGDKENQTIFHVAAQKMDDIVLDIFIDMGHVCDIPDTAGNTPLQILVEKYLTSAKSEKLKAVIMRLIKKGARVDFPNKKGETVLTHIFGSTDKQFIVEACIQLCESREPDENLLKRLKTLLADPVIRSRLIQQLFKTDFSAATKGLIKLMDEALLGCEFTYFWFDWLKEDPNNASRLCKLDVLKKAGFLKSIIGQLTDPVLQERYPAIVAWLEQNKAIGMRRLPLNIHAAMVSSSPVIVSPRLTPLHHAASVPSFPKKSGIRPMPLPPVRSASATSATLSPRISRPSSSSSLDPGEMTPPASATVPSSPAASPRQSFTGSAVIHSPSSSTVPSSPVASRRQSFMSAPSVPPLPVPPELLRSATSTSIPIPSKHRRKPSTNGLPDDYPEKSNSWTFTLVEKPAGRQRRSTVTDFKKTFNLITVQQQLARNDEIEKKLAHTQIRENMGALVTSEDRNIQEFTKEFLKKNPRWINQKYEGTTLLNMTVSAGRLEMSKFLLESGADVNGWDDDLNTPLYHALWMDIKLDEKIAKFVSLLLQADADIKRVIGSGSAQNDLNRRSFNLLLDQSKISPKLVVAALLKQPFEEKDVHMQSVLKNALEKCEKMGVAEVQGLAVDVRDESLECKVVQFKHVPRFYCQILESLLATTDCSIRLLKVMLSNKETGVVPDYTRVYLDTDKTSRRAKLQLLIDLEIIPVTKKTAEQLASGKQLPMAEALVVGLTNLSPDLSEANWPKLLQELAAGRQTLTELQETFLKVKMPTEQEQVRGIMAMIFQQDFCRSDPFVKEPFESMLEVNVQNCRQVWPELIGFLQADKDSKSRDRKLEICKANKDFKGLLDFNLKTSAVLNEPVKEVKNISPSASVSTTPRGNKKKDT